jgi:DNA helicase-2/ATP-dependent DNA helicase PcrA
MQMLNTFFDFIKEECGKKPRMHVTELLDLIAQMQQEKLILPILRVVAMENGVNFITAHSAKGLEFEHVFVIGCTPDAWEKKRGTNTDYKIPPSLVGASDNLEESTRRLFYVAITRAKTHLQVSYAAKNNSDKAITASTFVSEILPFSNFQKTIVSEEEVMDQLKWAFEPDQEVNIELIKKEFIESRLKNFAMSASALNKYIKCPVAFYYETILQVPSAPNDTLAFGNAVHYALEMLFKEMQTSPGQAFPSVEETIRFFEKSMKKQEDCFTDKQYPRRMELGKKVLSAYYEKYITGFNKTVSVEKMIAKVAIGEVPIKGKIDKIEFDGNNCTVIDYKTGNAAHSIKDRLAIPDDDHPNGGEYWRQMVFYKLLIDNHPFNTWKMVDGIFDFIEADEDSGKFIRHQVVIRDEDVTTVKKQIKDTYEKIMNHEFAIGCQEENCQWCSFVTNNQLYKKPAPEDAVAID